MYKYIYIFTTIIVGLVSTYGCLPIYSPNRTQLHCHINMLTHCQWLIDLIYYQLII